MSSETGSPPTQSVIPYPRVIAAAGLLVVGFLVYSIVFFRENDPLWRERAAVRELSSIRQALDAYVRDCGEPPPAGRWEAALTTDPGAKGWRGPYLHIRGPVFDPWRRPFVYRRFGVTYTLVCAGPDGILGTADDLK